MELDSFVEKLKTLCLEYGVVFLGNHKLVTLEEAYRAETLEYALSDCISLGNGVHDRCGPFLQGKIEKVEVKTPQVFEGGNLQVLNWDRVMGDGIKSMVDGKHYTSRRKYNEHLKSRGFEEVGNDSSLYRDHHGNDLNGIREGLVRDGKIRQPPN